MAETHTCAHCGAEFKPYRSWARYCSAKCRVTAWDQAHPRVTRRTKPETLPIVRAMTAALESLVEKP